MATILGNQNTTVTDKEIQENNPYKGTPYEEMYLMNPYRNQTYTLGWWDKLGNTLGFRTQEDDVREENAQKAAIQDLNIEAMKQQNEYNSEAAQIQRQKEAGINPDLAGMTENMEAANLEGVPEPTDLNSGENLEAFNNAVVHALNFAIGMTGNIVDLDAKIMGKEQGTVEAAIRLAGTGMYDEGINAPSMYSRKRWQKNFKNAFEKYNNGKYGQVARDTLQKEAGEAKIDRMIMENSKYLTGQKSIEELASFYDDIREYKAKAEKKQWQTEGEEADLNKGIALAKKRLVGQLMSDYNADGTKKDESQKLFDAMLLMGFSNQNYDILGLVGKGIKEIGGGVLSGGMGKATKAIGKLKLPKQK